MVGGVELGDALFGREVARLLVLDFDGSEFGRCVWKYARYGEDLVGRLVDLLDERAEIIDEGLQLVEDGFAAVFELVFLARRIGHGLVTLDELAGYGVVGFGRGMIGDGRNGVLGCVHADAIVQLDRQCAVHAHPLHYAEEV